MDFNQRHQIIEKLESLRGSKILTYVTSIRPGVNAQISDDAVREFIDHLRLFPEQPTAQIDLFIVSNGGDGVVPWRLIPILREFAKRIGILIPFKAYSAATLMALGADEIVMHKFGALGPIDPTVTNEFNPVEVGTNRRLGISVEDVKAYVAFIRNTVGINHEEEVIRAIEPLVQKVHPLALGNVERFIAQSRMIAEKLLTLHTPDPSDAHKVSSVIEALASKLYFHGHPINRAEARQLGLKAVENVPGDVETLLWELFVSYEEQMQFRKTFDPLSQLQALPQAPVTHGNSTELAVIETDVLYAAVESLKLSSAYNAKTRYTLVADAAGNRSVSQVTLDQGWKQASPPVLPSPHQ